MKRREFIKQSVVVAAGVVAGSEVLPAIGSTLPAVESEFKAMPLSRYAGILGVDIAKAPDLAGAFEIFDGVRTRSYFGISPSPNEDGAYSYYKSILDEADNRQTPWGRMISQVAMDELTKEEEG